MKEMRHQYTLYPDVQHDVVEGRALSLLRIPNIIYRPCLVQHLDKDSLIQGHTDGRRCTPYFPNYLDELGISYEEAYKHKDKLISLMNSKFENYYLIKSKGWTNEITNPHKKFLLDNME